MSPIAPCAPPAEPPPRRRRAGHPPAAAAGRAGAGPGGLRRAVGHLALPPLPRGHTAADRDRAAPPGPRAALRAGSRGRDDRDRVRSASRSGRGTPTSGTWPTSPWPSGTATRSAASERRWWRPARRCRPGQASTHVAAAVHPESRTVLGWLQGARRRVEARASRRAPRRGDRAGRSPRGASGPSASASARETRHRHPPGPLAQHDPSAGHCTASYAVSSNADQCRPPS